MKCEMSRNKPRNDVESKNLGNEFTAKWKILHNELNDELLSVFMILKYSVFIFCKCFNGYMVIATLAYFTCFIIPYNMFSLT